MFKRILIANRGEIAMRVIRACRELGIRTVAIYAECDATAIFVKKADEAHLVGPGPMQGFLDMQAIVDLAKRSGADGIHPGYGFLSENADFAKLCETSGITFIGPSPEAIRLMGNKVQAREIARQAGVPIVPGTEKSVTNPTEALSFAARTGYPLMVKASMGGGGRGLHVVRNDQELLSQMEVARREALSSFGNGEIFLEKYIERPHHIEFQILADKHGNIIHLGERDCSIQRRHQKLIEIAPSLVLDKELRARMGEAAIAVAKAVNYDNAGTVEFILDPNRNFYFIEMNTRIQVEHTITEQITAIDLVRSQIDRRGPPPGILPGGCDAAGARHPMPDQRRGSAEQLPAVHRHRDRLFLARWHRRAHRRHGVQGLHDPPLLRRAPGQAGRARADLGGNSEPGPPLAGGVRAAGREDHDPFHEADYGGPGLSGGPVRHQLS